ncbi:hypothetical protein FSP39_000741 [Pinctada imbricata]|uniref:TIR domain-containing protein n=1 Tax=Pinctada imbricata TaxID=66713 RepID=A0AA88XTI1_PINIB|nr:hypothetical protein FSP39_000741 [Pinctada imbricata]
MDSLRRIPNAVYLIILIALNIQVSVGENEKLPWKPWCKISVKSKTAKCSSHGKNLTRIPDLPSFVQKLYLDSDRFWVLKTETFKPVIENNLSLISLSLKASQVHSINEDAFKSLSSLQSLDLSANLDLNIPSLKKSLAGLRSKRLRTLSFNSMQWTAANFSAQLFRSLSGKAIYLLGLAKNNFTYIPNSSMEGLERLRRIDLSFNKLEQCERDLQTLDILEYINFKHNHITGCNLEYMPKTIQVLQLEDNRIPQIPSFCTSSKTPILPALQKLVLDGNLISSLTKGSFECIPLLKYLGLSLNNIRRFRSQVFSILPNLEVLKLSHMKRKVIRVDQGAFSIPKLRKLYIDRNYLDFNLINNARHASLENCSKLELLDLSYNYMPKWPLDTKYILSGLNSLRKIHLEQVSWNILPNELFKMIPNVKEVDLSWNKITQLNSSLFRNKSEIVRMNLDSNRIAHVGPHTFPEVFWKSIKSIDLSANPFACDCELLWFRDFLRKSKKMNITFKQYPRQYNCLSPPEKKGVSLADFNMTWQDCEKNSDFILIISTTGSIVFAGLMIAITAYKCRWHVRYWIYLLRYKKKGYNRIIDEDFKFDGFIIYSDADSDFVHNTLIAKLEDENGYKMCVHYRDFEVGKVIVDNIVECMSKSRQALVVVSKKFCQSKWCNFELLVAQDRWLRDEGDPLVVLMLEEVGSRHMTKGLRALIQTTTYCSWTENEVGQELFWGQLFRSLKKFAE